MKNRRYRKYVNMCLAILLISTECVPAYALDEKVKEQLAAVKSLVELDYESNAESIRILLDQCIDQLSDDEPIKSTLQSVKLLLATENANTEAVTVLLDTALEEDSQEDEETAADEETGTAGEASVENETQEKAADSSAETSITPDNTGTALNDTMVFPDIESVLLNSDTTMDNELPVFEVENYRQTYVPTSVLMDVPGEWGNNAASGRSLVSYSPVNASGAINPKAGTLTISHFAMESDDVEKTFEDYEKSIADMSVTSDMHSEDISTASLPAKKLNFSMNVGANQFTCETVCFIYEETVYAIELLQGQQSSYNYFPVLGEVLQSAEISGKDGAVVTEETVETADAAQTEEAAETADAAQTEETAETADAAQTEETAETADAAQTEETAEAADAAQTEETGSQDKDISSFIYYLNGHEYQFPTPVSEINQGDLNIDRQQYLPYDLSSDADMTSGSWTEIVNTEYFYFENSLYKEMAGITNMTGYGTNVSDGIVTALIDTNGSYLDIVLPGNVHVGSSEKDILNGFPAFASQEMNGNAKFVNNNYLYACNVRDDGCHGYVIVRNDDPFYSAVSIICEDAVIKEISFECLGAERARGVFDETM